MTEYYKPGVWRPGNSGNPKGRPPKNRVLTRILEEVTDETINIGGEELTAKEAIGRLVTQFMLRGEVMLGGKLMEATVSEWLAMIRWFYTHVDGAAPKTGDMGETPEVVVRVVRVDEDDSPHPPTPGAVYPHPPTPSPFHGEGERESPMLLLPDGE